MMAWIRIHCDTMIFNMTAISGLITMTLCIYQLITDTSPIWLVS
jgi:hypothetical protein